MKTFSIMIFLGIFLLVACTPSPTSAPEEVSPGALLTDTPTAITEGRTIIILNTSDNGPGTLRQALEDAGDYDTITFDPAVFPPDAPVPIFITSELPHIRRNNLTLDASNAGVILDGSQVPGDWVAGLQVVDSEANKIMGLQVNRFPGPGISISGESRHNVIGGDRGVGSGPYGQGNLLSNNAIGIDLVTEGTTLNTITGNLIGTDLEGSKWLGNERDGISLTEGAHDNTIGPNNIIANNGEQGINFGQSETQQNADTQNDIYDNDRSQIIPVVPTIFGYDLAEGIVTGATCPVCTVEIFSTSNGEGVIFEAKTTADDNGAFNIKTGTPFSGLSLTATTTNTIGITSEFTSPFGVFGIPEGSMILQQGNDSPGSYLLQKPSQFLSDNHIGAWFEDYKKHDMDFVYRNGFKRIRIGSLAGEGQRWMTIINEDTLSDEVDQTITEFVNEGVEIELILASGAGIPFADGIFQSEWEFDQFAEYVSFVVSHFKGRINAYEIWNEPGHMQPEVYAKLVERVVPVIREKDEEAKIIIGAIQGNWDNGYPGYGEYQRFSVDMVYLNRLLQSGVVDLVDGISWHPMYDNIPSDPYYQNYPELFQNIKNLAVSQGFTGEYFADEIMWTTVDEENWDNGPPSSQLIAAKYFTRTITEHRGLGINITINTFFQVPFLSPIQNLCVNLAGAEPTDITLSIGTTANIRSYAFVLPNGEKLVALWTNDTAVEDDPGIETTITIPDFSANEVIGIDVLNSFEQELITKMENGNLVIQNLRIKDYPILIKLSQ